jgi:hypothetical protein
MRSSRRIHSRLQVRMCHVRIQTGNRRVWIARRLSHSYLGADRSAREQFGMNGIVRILRCKVTGNRKQRCQ